MATIVAPINADALRLRHEFIELPGLRLTIPQIARLLGVAPARAVDLVDTLLLEGFLESDDACPMHFGRPGIVHEPTSDSVVRR